MGVGLGGLLGVGSGFVSGDDVGGEVYADLVLLGASFPLGFDEGFRFSRVMLCVNGIRSPVMGWLVGRGCCGMCGDDVYGCCWVVGIAEGENCITFCVRVVG